MQCANNLTVENHFQFYCIELLACFLFISFSFVLSFAKSQTESTLINPLDSEKMVCAFGLGELSSSSAVRNCDCLCIFHDRVLCSCFAFRCDFHPYCLRQQQWMYRWWQEQNRNRREMRLFSIFHVFRLNLLTLFLTDRARRCRSLFLGVWRNCIRCACACAFIMSFSLSNFYRAEHLAMNK